MILTNVLGLPEALVSAVANDSYDNQGSWRSVTELIAPPQIAVLKRQHANEITEDASDRLYSLYGQIVHGILERANTVDRVEERLFIECHGKKISGQFDSLCLQNGRLSDYKFSTVWKYTGTHDEWTAQLNCLSLLLRKQGFDVKEIEVVLLMRDFSKRRAMREKDYPQMPVARIPLILWSPEQQEAYLEARVQIHKSAEEGTVPECTAEERWQKGTVYAVMETGKKKAKKLYDDKEYADSHVALDPETFSIVIRPGESVRCEAFCSVSKFCHQICKMKLDASRPSQGLFEGGEQ